VFVYVVIVGATGQLGVAVRRQLERRGLRPIALAPHELDLTDAGAGEQLIQMGPSAVINAAAWTDVRAAELPENREAVWQVNCHGAAMLAAAAASLEVPFVHVSTDFVFDGQSDRPYLEQDAVAPLQAYGASKLDGEVAVLERYPEATIARTSTVYGDRPEGPPHYVDAILAQARQRPRIEVVRLPVSSPSYTPDLAAGILKLLEVRAPGLVHLVNAGAASRMELAQEAVRLAGYDCEVAEREAPADDLQRPDYSVLDTARYAALTGQPMRDWDVALADYIETLGGGAR
jgi:dTDP-4-dehydrorhamnose reductase